MPVEADGVRFPEHFPHTRHEQYVLAMPEELLTNPERTTRELVLDRFCCYARRLVLPLLTEAMSRGSTVEEFVEEFLAAFEGRLPAVFRR